MQNNTIIAPLNMQGAHYTALRIETKHYAGDNVLKPPEERSQKRHQYGAFFVFYPLSCRLINTCNRGEGENLY